MGYVIRENIIIVYLMYLNFYRNLTFIGRLELVNQIALV